MKGLSPDELATLTDDTVSTLRSLVDKLERRSWEDGMAWYHAAHAQAKVWAQEYGVPFEYVAGIIAALSPRIQWDVNLSDAESILEDGERASTAAFGPNVIKALWILDGIDPDNELGGRKVRSFWQNIAYPYRSMDVTLDGWMASILGHEAKFLERKGTYDALSDAFRTVADSHGIMPHELQAALWIQAHADKARRIAS